jgi:hypothetical protein
LAVGQGDDRFLHVGALVGTALPALGLALDHNRVHARHLAIVDGLDSLLDLRLGRIAGDLEHNRVVFRRHRRLLGDVRRDNHVIVTRIDFLLLSH